jgi:CYTH domain-containing protein
MIEIERKFLLKSLPDIEPVDKIKIWQYYYKNPEGIWERARQMDYKSKGKKFVHTIKTRISDMSNDEQEKELTRAEFYDFRRRCVKYPGSSKMLKKTRYVYAAGDLKWEVDLFQFAATIVIAEVEIPSEEHDLQIPDFISKKMLLEVTSMKQFGNRSLANKLK